MRTSALCAALLLIPFGTALSQASRTTTIIETDFNIVDGNPCSGEPIQYAGTIQEVLHEVVNSNGTHSAYTLTLKGLSAVGLETGIQYRSTGASHTSSNSNDPGGPLTLVSNTQFVGQGDGVVFFASFVFHTTVNANGDLVVVVENFRAECR